MNCVVSNGYTMYKRQRKYKFLIDVRQRLNVEKGRSVGCENH